MRRVLAFIMLFVIVFYLYTEIDDKGFVFAMEEFKYVTRWGEWFTLMAMLMGSFVNNYECEAIEDFNY